MSLRHTITGLVRLLLEGVESGGEGATKIIIYISRSREGTLC